MVMLGFLGFIVGGPLLAGLLYAVAAAVLRRRFGALAAFGFMIIVIAAALLFVKSVQFPPGALAIPAVPAAAAAAGVLEWRARRRAPLAQQITWTTLTFTLVGSVVLYDLGGHLMMVA